MQTHCQKQELPNVVTTNPKVLICPVLSPDATQERRGGAAGGGGAAARHCSFPKWSWGEGADGEAHSWNVPPHTRIYCLLLGRQVTYLVVSRNMCKLASDVLKRYIILLFCVCNILCCYPAYSAWLIFLKSLSQRQKNSYSVYPKTDPTPVTSSAPPVSTLYTPPVVRCWIIYAST